MKALLPGFSLGIPAASREPDGNWRSIREWEMNRHLFRILGFGLLLLAWSWVTLSAIPGHVAKFRQVSSDASKRADTIRTELDEVTRAQVMLATSDLDPTQVLRFRIMAHDKKTYLIGRLAHLNEVSVDALPNRWIAGVADNAGWVFAAGILIFGWLSCLLAKAQPSATIAYLAEAWRTNSWHVSRQKGSRARSSKNDSRSPS